MLDHRYDIARGNLQTLLNNVASNTASLLRFVEEFKKEFWALDRLLPEVSKRLTYCCSPDIIPLMELNGVKINRAKQLREAGIKEIKDLCKYKPHELVKKIPNLNYHQAKALIKAARHYWDAKRDALQGLVSEIEEISASLVKTYS